MNTRLPPGQLVYGKHRRYGRKYRVVMRRLKGLPWRITTEDVCRRRWFGMVRRLSVLKMAHC